MEGRITTLQGPGKEYAEEEASDDTEASPTTAGESQGTGRPKLAQSNQPVFHQSKPSLLAIMQQITQIMANIQAYSSSGASRHPL
ncbi:hypothetical protein O181_099707 [Austropuccinia psidii MF-1]|uniref:Uncharacterized protein n=1 Tax=Austropuccinia psidii MF-1 TaxID=1389203 RepID=A0A9Q3JCS2_9BASI|nr:hypothetical protein [Austropuccinia psidii MF-1]